MNTDLAILCQWDLVFQKLIGNVFWIFFAQAKERELELKNSWAENKLTRRQTQAKYGF